MYMAGRVRNSELAAVFKLARIPGSRIGKERRQRPTFYLEGKKSISYKKFFPFALVGFPTKKSKRRLGFQVFAVCNGCY